MSLSRPVANEAHAMPFDTQTLPGIKCCGLSLIFSPTLKHLRIAWLCLYGSARIGSMRSRHRSVALAASTETQQNRCGVESAVAIGISRRSLSSPHYESFGTRSVHTL